MCETRSDRFLSMGSEARLLYYYFLHETRGGLGEIDGITCVRRMTDVSEETIEELFENGYLSRDGGLHFIPTPGCGDPFLDSRESGSSPSVADTKVGEGPRSREEEEAVPSLAPFFPPSPSPAPLSLSPYNPPFPSSGEGEEPPLNPPRGTSPLLAPPRGTPSSRPDDEDTDGFAAFWAAYPRKVAKQEALKAWRKLKPNPRLRERIIAAVTEERNSDQWKRDGGQFIPHPATYLRGARWEDEGVKVVNPTDAIYNESPEDFLARLTPEQRAALDAIP